MSLDRLSLIPASLLSLSAAAAIVLTPLLAQSETVVTAPAPKPAGGPLSDEALDRLIQPANMVTTNGTRLSLVFNGFRRSQTDPCGCPSTQLGGFDKEARILQRIKAQGNPVLLADAGGIYKEFTSEPDLVRSAGLMKAMKSVGYTTINVGFPDLLHGSNRIREAAQAAGLKIVSANAAKLDGTLHFDPFVVETIKVGDRDLRVAYVGSTRQRLQGSSLLSSPFSGGPNTQHQPNDVKILDPVEALKTAIPAARQQADVVVLLHFGRRDQVPDMLKALGTEVEKAIDVIVTGEWGGPLPVETTENFPLLVATGFEGRQVTHAVLEVPAEGRPTRGGAAFVEVTQDIPPVAEVTAMVEEARKAAMGALVSPAPGVPNIPSPQAAR